MSALRVALVFEGWTSTDAAAAAGTVRTLAHGLLERGHAPTVLAARPGLSWGYDDDDRVPIVLSPRLPEAILRLRGFAVPVTHVPLIARALASGSYDVAHAFSPVDAVAAQLARRRTAAPVVFTCLETLGRQNVADRRLRLASLRAAVEESDAVAVPGEDARVALERWMAAEALVVDPSDAAAHEDLYCSLVGK